MFQTPRSALFLTMMIAAIPLAGQDPVPAVLPDITVSVARSDQSLGMLGMAVTVVDLTLTRLNGGITTIEESLGFVPGLVVRDRGDLALENRISIRGAGARANFGSRGVQILIDGVPATLADGQSPLTFLDLELADRIEVARGPLAALHGNGSNGVISLSTPARFGKSLMGRAAVAGGSNATNRMLFATGAGGADLGGMLAFSRLETHGSRDHSSGEQHRFRGALEWRATASSRLTVRGQLADDPWLEAPGALTPSEFATDPRSASPSAVLRATGKQLRQQQLSLNWERTGAGGGLTVTGWLLGRELFNPIGLRPTAATGESDGTLISIDRSVAGLRSHSSWQLGESAWGTLGVDLQRQSDERTNSVHTAGVARPASTFLDQLQTVTTLGPFGQFLVSVGNGVVARAGVRHDRVSFDVVDRLGEGGGSRTMSAWSASGAVALTNGSTEYWIGAGSAFETPTTTELAGDPEGITGINDLLDPAVTWTVEAGIRHRRGGNQIEIVGWRSRTRDAIRPVEQVDGRSYFSNIGETDNVGLEVAGVLALSRIWRATVSMTAQSPSFGSEAIDRDGVGLVGNRLPGIPALDLRLGVVGRLGPIRLAIDHALSGSLWTDDLNRLEVPGWGFGVTGASVRWQPNGSVSLIATGRNIFDKAYAASVVVNGFAGRVIEPGPGRTLMLGMEVRRGT